MIHYENIGNALIVDLTYSLRIHLIDAAILTTEENIPE